VGAEQAAIESNVSSVPVVITTHDVMISIRFTVAELFNCRHCRYVRGPGPVSSHCIFFFPGLISILVISSILFATRHRTHFLQMYDSCKYDRCSVRSDDYAALQLWLWRVHNDVTLRILSFHLPPHEGATGESKAWVDRIDRIRTETRWEHFHAFLRCNYDDTDCASCL
jgi:hypothetical protein